MARLVDGTGLGFCLAVAKLRIIIILLSDVEKRNICNYQEVEKHFRLITKSRPEWTSEQIYVPRDKKAERSQDTD